MSELGELLEIARKAAELAGRVIMPLYESALTVELKADRTPVTAADRGAEEAIRAFLARECPAHGVLGEEFGEHAGLGLIPGRVQPVPACDAAGQRHRIPHIGWSRLERPPARASWDATILSAIPVGEPVYFVHSFAPVPAHEAHRLADTFYDGVRICAAVARDQIYGCQFHPERSGPHGLRMLSTFLEL